jgi:hypothetical protein
MRRFLLKQDELSVEGVMFSDGFIVIHGMFFVGMNVVSKYELGKMFPKAKVEWIDKEEKSEAVREV